MVEIIKRVIVAYKRRFVKKLKRRSALERFKSRQYYRKHRSSIRLQRRRYSKRNKIFTHSRKLFKRTKPSWLTGKKKVRIPKSKIHKKPALRKIHVPKRKKH